MQIPDLCGAEHRKGRGSRKRQGSLAPTQLQARSSVGGTRGEGKEGSGFRVEARSSPCGGAGILPGPTRNFCKGGSLLRVERKPWGSHSPTPNPPRDWAIGDGSPGVGLFLERARGCPILKAGWPYRPPTGRRSCDRQLVLPRQPLPRPSPERAKRRALCPVPGQAGGGAPLQTLDGGEPRPVGVYCRGRLELGTDHRPAFHTEGAPGLGASLRGAEPDPTKASGTHSTSSRLSGGIPPTLFPPRFQFFSCPFKGLAAPRKECTTGCRLQGGSSRSD